MWWWQKWLNIIFTFGISVPTNLIHERNLLKISLPFHNSSRWLKICFPKNLAEKDTSADTTHRGCRGIREGRYVGRPWAVPCAIHDSLNLLRVVENKTMFDSLNHSTPVHFTGRSYFFIRCTSSPWLLSPYLVHRYVLFIRN